MIFTKSILAVETIQLVLSPLRFHKIPTKDTMQACKPSSETEHQNYLDIDITLIIEITLINEMIITIKHSSSQLEHGTQGSSTVQLIGTCATSYDTQMYRPLCCTQIQGVHRASDENLNNTVSVKPSSAHGLEVACKHSSKRD
jgi:hypothetical protein